jgi:hypothetical protein
VEVKSVQQNIGNLHGELELQDGCRFRMNFAYVSEGKQTAVDIKRGSFRIQDELMFLHISEGSRESFLNDVKIVCEDISCEGMTLQLVANRIETSDLHKTNLVPEMIFTMCDNSPFSTPNLAPNYSSRNNVDNNNRQYTHYPAQRLD